MAVGDSGGWVRGVRGEREKTVDEEQAEKGDDMKGIRWKGQEKKINRAWPFFLFF